MPENIVTMYSTPWCGYCRRLTAQMDREGIAYRVVDIDEHPDAAEIVMAANGGNQTVPTVVLPDGSALTNPSIAQIRERIGHGGHEPRLAIATALPELLGGERAAVPVLDEPPGDRDA